jgi:hypothetical protein
VNVSMLELKTHPRGFPDALYLNYFNFRITLSAIITTIPKGVKIFECGG